MQPSSLLALTATFSSIFSVLAQSQIVLEGSERSQCAQVTKLEGILNFINDTAQLAEYETRHNLTKDEVDDIVDS